MTSHIASTGLLEEARILAVAYGEHPADAAVPRVLLTLAAEVERLREEADNLANGPYYPEDVVRERLRALLDDRTETT